MAQIAVLEFAISDRAESKFAIHGISAQQVKEILYSRIVALKNRKHRAAPFVVVGRDVNGRCIAVPVLPTENPTIWQPVTAWYCKPSEAAKLR